MKEKLPEFFDSNDHFSIDKFENALREHNIDEVTNGYH
ncbi:hypothetical protein B808_424 [Fructilactobacillus florum 8D]|uniref:Uncharacterized protein n=1 Tax=Fructilactobacillus florum 8D TaxID=1221538 RepID=W9EI05_9LACO|nr:hypothetical protein B808_424 [Fructilactobacillus florum 8D]